MIIVKMRFHYVKEVNYDNLHACLISYHLHIIKTICVYIVCFLLLCQTGITLPFLYTSTVWKKED